MCIGGSFVTLCGIVSQDAAMAFCRRNRGPDTGIIIIFNEENSSKVKLCIFYVYVEQ